MSFILLTFYSIFTRFIHSLDGVYRKYCIYTNVKQVLEDINNKKNLEQYPGSNFDRMDPDQNEKNP